MPTVHRLVVLLGALIVVGGCATDDEVATQATPVGAAVPYSTTPVQAPPPAAGATPEAVADWIAAGRPVNPEDFRTVERDGTVTRLKPDEVAFRLPGDLQPNALAGCIRRWTPNLSCLPGLRDAPHRPDGLDGQWVGEWVDFDGSMISVGGLHGDPGAFDDGPGRPLAYGDSLKFGDYQCRSDPTGLYCISLSRRTGLRLSDAVTAFGCTRQATPPYDIGEQFYCD